MVVCVWLLQVLDDSTDAMTRELVDDKVLEWRERGVNVVCIRRPNRQGYKAGALKDVSNHLIPVRCGCRFGGFRLNSVFVLTGSGAPA